MFSLGGLGVVAYFLAYWTAFGLIDPFAPPESMAGGLVPAILTLFLSGLYFSLLGGALLNPWRGRWLAHWAVAGLLVAGVATVGLATFFGLPLRQVFLDPLLPALCLVFTSIVRSGAGLGYALIYVMSGRPRLRLGSTVDW